MQEFRNEEQYVENIVFYLASTVLEFLSSAGHGFALNDKLYLLGSNNHAAVSGVLSWVGSFVPKESGSV
jgi:hypothetical protein